MANGSRRDIADAGALVPVVARIPLAPTSPTAHKPPNLGSRTQGSVCRACRILRTLAIIGAVDDLVGQLTASDSLAVQDVVHDLHVPKVGPLAPPRVAGRYRSRLGRVGAVPNARYVRDAEDVVADQDVLAVAYADGAPVRAVVESWVKLAVAPNETSALLIEAVLKCAGVPSQIQPAPGFDVPDFLPAGPRAVLGPSSLLEEAKQVLEDTKGLGVYVPQR